MMLTSPVLTRNNSGVFTVVTVLVCLDCGASWFKMPTKELPRAFSLFG